MDTTSTLIDDVAYLGGEVKALGDGRVGGYLVRFDSIDIQGDMFTAATDFGLDISTKTALWYHHAIQRRNDPHSARLGNRRLGAGEVKALEDGLWIEAPLDLSKPGIPELYADIVAGKMGWSSGTGERQVRRSPIPGKSNCYYIEQWVLNDASVTPTPVESRNRVISLKSLLDSDGEDGASNRPDGAATRSDVAAAATLLDRLTRLATDSRETRARIAHLVEHRKADGRTFSREKLDAIKALEPEWQAWLKAIEELKAEEEKGEAASPAPPPPPITVDPDEFAALLASARPHALRPARS